MRVLLIHDYGTATGGAEHQVLAVRQGLRDRGHEVELFTTNASLQPAPIAADHTCFGTTRPRLQALTRTANPSAYRQLRRVVQRFQPDVAHIRMFLHQLSPLILPALGGVPTVYQAVVYKSVCPTGLKVLPDGSPCTDPAGRACLRHRCVTPQTWVLSMTQLRLLRRWWRRIDAVIAVSRATAAHLEEAGLGPVEVIYNGVSPRPPQPPPTDPPLVVFAGRLVPEKGVGALLHALAQVTPDVPAARALIVGDGPHRAALQDLARELNLTDRVEFAGYLDRPALEARFDAAWVQAVPGLWAEPFGNVVTEAMVRGTAVVASDVGGPAELVDHGQTGLLVPPGDIHALAAALRDLLTDPARCRQLGEAGRRIALDRYTRDAALDRYLAVYERVIAARAASAAPQPARPEEALS